MKTTKRFWTICVLAVVFVLSFALAACDTDTPTPTPPDNTDKPNWTLNSPDGKIKADIYFANGQIAYAVTKDGIAVVEKSNLGMATDQCEFVDLTFVSEQTSEDTISYTNITGKTRQVTTSYKQNVLTFAEGDYTLDVVFRTYNDGYAFRYNIR